MFIFFFRYSFVILLIFCLIFDFECFLLFFSLIFIHFFCGLQSILKDYIHQIEIKLFLNFLVRLMFFFILNISIELWF
uniref:Succinate dehydrogenase subunit 4 n=1 Tax=Symphyocladia marchantioides TaxID=88360 RepID=UPI0022FD9C5F|nr:Succinate dehydrogenase subunit 4 [Symphyocladia marchantioides]WAX04056.1 Succinate dehydrogenase subunit 4 [Symphyocladia marchantioides]